MARTDIRTQAERWLRRDEALEFASHYLVAGMTTPGRRRPELENRPFFVSRGQGAYLWDLEGRKYIDLSCGHGGALVGHSHPAILAALRKGLEMGILCGQETVLPGRVAKWLVEMVPSAELVRFMFTGTEATALAVRVARAFTGKLKIVKFEGHYHGHNDVLQFNYSTPLDDPGPRSSPPVRGESAGTIPEVGNHVCVLPWNDLDPLENLLKREGDQIAGIIMEPINFNNGGLLPRDGYLEGVRALSEQYKVVLIFDEILSGFRTGPDCVQGYLGVTPDLTTLAKAIGGGLPISALVGRKELMETLAPVGGVINQGTYYGQVLVMHAAEAFLEIAADPAMWQRQKKLEKRLYDGLGELFRRYQAGQMAAVGNRFGFYFGTDEELREWRELAQVDWGTHLRFYRAALDHGVFFMTGWHHGFSWVHTEKDIDDALEGIEASLREVQKD